jgi:type I restriction enzyme M protein
LAAPTRESREAANKAEVIENAAYDPKVVNPHRRPEVDTRAPDELLDLIEAKGSEVAEAVSLLRGRR